MFATASLYASDFMKRPNATASTSWQLVVEDPNKPRNWLSSSGVSARGRSWTPNRTASPNNVCAALFTPTVFQSRFARDRTSATSSAVRAFDPFICFLAVIRIFKKRIYADPRGRRAPSV